MGRENGARVGLNPGTRVGLNPGTRMGLNQGEGARGKLAFALNGVFFSSGTAPNRSG
jgi:hypothetical protein